MRRRSLLASSSGGNESSFNYEDYMTIEALEDLDVYFEYFESPVETNLEGTEWIETPSQVHIPSGKRLSVRKITPQGDSVGNITVDGQFNLSGNCLSLIFGGDAKNNKDLTGYDYVFDNLFGGNTGLISVGKDFLPATTLANRCYRSMFSGCKSLVSAPELPATPPYGGLPTDCYRYMFRGCTSLVSAPELPATRLGSYCYTGMFDGCTSLVNAPELPATRLVSDCYYMMFRGCTSLINAPELPATKLASYCYQEMFYGCTSLVNAPELPATTLAKYCYSSMFKGCKKLNYIKMMATDISASYCLYEWVNGVASAGTFVKNKNATWDVTGNSGVPSRWTIITQ